jgi:DNA replicative helicase MCM subunit Mcm2 (Cdc46/Mcm family)
MVCKLNTRASVIATSNAKNGRYYNINGSLQENTGLKSPHLSRFDLILLLIDEKNNGSCWDDEISGFILNNYELEGVTKVQRELNHFDHEPNETNPIG